MSDLPAWGSGAPGGATAHETGSRPGSVRVSLAHDYLLVMRGAERVFAAISDLFAEAPIVTLLYDRQALGWRFQGRSVTTSPLQRLGVDQDNFRRMLPLYPAAASRLPVPPCDALISSSSAFAHGARAPAGAVHVCYCHSPFRYVWHEHDRALAETPPALRLPMRGVLDMIRRWDLAASERVDRYMANSLLTRERIRSFYGREAAVVHPPVETTRFAPGEPGDELLLVSEIVAHKRVGVALEAARRARVPIAVAGSGPDHDALASAYPEARFLGRVDDEQLARLYAQREGGAGAGDGGVRDHRRRGPGRRAAGDRRAGRGGAGDRDRGPHRAAGPARRRRGLPPGDRTPRQASVRSRRGGRRTRTASRWRPSAGRCRPSSTRPSSRVPGRAAAAARAGSGGAD